MANILPIEKQALVVGLLANGNSLRAIESATGVHRDTVMRLGVKVGEACGKMLHEQMRGLDCRHIQLDEQWGFIGKKQRNVLPDDNGFVGDVWVFVAIDPETKIVPSHVVGKRDWQHTMAFVSDLSSRVKNRIQISADGMNGYLETIQEAFGTDVDFGQIVKVYGGETEGARRYSPPPIKAITKKAVYGEPDLETVSTSHVERFNGTTRNRFRPLTRLTHGFSKKIEHFQAGIALNFAAYNFVHVHRTLKSTPAITAGIAKRHWTWADLVDLAK